MDGDDDYVGLCVEIPTSLFRAFRAKCEADGVTMQDAVLRWLYEELYGSAGTAMFEKLKASRDFVYLIGMDDRFYKIGVSGRPRVRMKQMQTGMPYELSLVHAFPAANVRDAERALHTRYDHRRVRGEWFALSPAEVEEFKRLRPDDLCATLAEATAE
jgi:hypothetical protein